MKLAIAIWQKHIEVFESFDLLCVSNNLEEETKSTALFSALVTLEAMESVAETRQEFIDIRKSIKYLQSSKYYSDNNINSEH